MLVCLLLCLLVQLNTSVCNSTLTCVHVLLQLCPYILVCVCVCVCECVCVCVCVCVHPEVILCSLCVCVFSCPKVSLIYSSS